MNNKVMFVIGCIIFITYVYFLLKIIRKQHKIQNKEHMNIHDTNDIDGMGNQGRIPDKKPRNRAM
jgi:amino acid permease